MHENEILDKFPIRKIDSPVLVQFEGGDNDIAGVDTDGSRSAI